MTEKDIEIEGKKYHIHSDNELTEELIRKFIFSIKISNNNKIKKEKLRALEMMLPNKGGQKGRQIMKSHIILL